ncbi:MAG: hypothetical protein ACXW2U_02305 [Telluria sp.]
MTQLRWIAAGLMAAFPLAALAQASPQPADPLDPKAQATAPGYVSAFAGYVPAASGQQATPDKTWRAANDNVAKSGGHEGHAAAAPVDHSQHAPAPAAVKDSAPADHGKHAPAPAPDAPKKAAPVDHSRHHGH